jgi:hypothetical protein
MIRTRTVLEKKRKKWNGVARYGKAFPAAFLLQVYKIAQLGATEQQIANFFDVSIHTLEYWRKTKPDFVRAMKQGGLEFDMKVAHTLGRRALGYDFVERSVKNGPDGRTITTSTKHIPGDVQAIKYWLNNRQRGIWSELNQISVNNTQINYLQNNYVPEDFSDFTEVELLALEKAGVKQLLEKNKAEDIQAEAIE